MNGIRFQVGTPRAGSAARIAEQDRQSRGIGTFAGSAARAVEAAKRAEGASGFTGARTIGMRATGGKAFSPEAAPTVPPASVPLQAVAQESSTGPMLPVAQVSAKNQAEEISQPGALQTAVSRVQSLVRSLFPGGRARTS